MKYLPLLLDVSGKPCLIIGGGIIATRRASTISRSGASIDVIAISATDSITRTVSLSGGTIHLRAWHRDDIEKRYSFVVAATNDKAVNLEIAHRCRALEIPVNVVTDSTCSDFAFPSILDRDPITIAVSSGSASPILARLLAERIDSLIPDGYGRLAGLVGKYRHRVRSLFDSTADRKAFWETVLTGAVAEQVFSGRPEQAETLLEHYLENPPTQLQTGEVYLIGAGPGDPDLLTFRAYRLLLQSDVIFHDRLVSKRILEQVNPDAELVHVGKQRAHHSVPQQDLNRLLVDHARQGRRVARLKGGDPFIFGRGGEEIEQLARHRIPFQVVPGITAASGCACYSGIPLTHRDHAQSVRFVTGQLKDGTVDLPWKELVAPDQTVAIYMGLQGLPVISDRLVAHGMDPDTPAAMIEQGTTPSQKIHCATISSLPRILDHAEVQPPTMLIIGSVVELHHSLNWFEQAPPSEPSF